jgi:hypothetical protein
MQPHPGRPVTKGRRAALPEAILPVVHRWFTHEWAGSVVIPTEWLIKNPPAGHAQPDLIGTCGSGVDRTGAEGVDTHSTTTRRTPAETGERMQPHIRRSAPVDGHDRFEARQ